MEYVAKTIDELYEICKMEDDDYDRSYPSQLRRLVWRLEDLVSRREKLMESDVPEDERFSFSDDDVRFIIPEAIKTIDCVDSTIALAKEDLLERFGIEMAGEEYMNYEEYCETESDDVIGGFIQLSFDEFSLIKNSTVA